MGTTMTKYDVVFHEKCFPVYAKDPDEAAHIVFAAMKCKVSDIISVILPNIKKEVQRGWLHKRTVFLTIHQHISFEIGLNNMGDPMVFPGIPHADTYDPEEDYSWAY
jgi:hypothetical protein